MRKLSFIRKTVCIIVTVFFLFSCTQEEEEEHVETMAFYYTIDPHPPMSVTLGWPNITGADEYILFRSINTSDNFIELVSSTGNNYIDKDFSYNTIYFYKITARKTGKVIRVSEIISITQKEPDGLSSSDGFWLLKDYTDYSFPEGVNSLWFRLSSLDGRTLRIRDRVSSSFSYTADVVVTIFAYYKDNLTKITIDGKYQDKIDSNSIYASDWKGTYYVLVEPKNNDETNRGTFAICFNN